ncbi:hypothetical protein SDC9_161013 [bioreactor metagenome]|uniref:Uncharacterized protein n=1 Tax=bioreactor metagenome TaxID=1076179 RepID=A0A645FK24_9ZZZZ
MAPVRLHRALPVGKAAEDGKGRVENRQAQNQKRHRKGDDSPGFKQPLYGHTGQNIP